MTSSRRGKRLERLLDGAEVPQQARAAISGLQVITLNLVAELRHFVEELLVALCLAHRRQEVQPDFLEERFQMLLRIG
ncbi:hypothetical protein D3C81_2152060 [compost metagenome]